MVGDSCLSKGFERAQFLKESLALDSRALLEHFAEQAEGVFALGLAEFLSLSR